MDKYKLYFYHSLKDQDLWMNKSYFYHSLRVLFCNSVKELLKMLDDEVISIHLNDYLTRKYCDC